MITGAEEDGEGNILSSNTEDQQDLSITDEVSHMEVSYSHMEVSCSHVDVRNMIVLKFVSRPTVVFLRLRYILFLHLDSLRYDMFK